MAINFLDGVSVNGELTTTGATNNITTTNATSNLYLLNLTRTSTSLTTAGNVGINGATSVDTPLDIAASSTGNNATFTKWYYSPNAETYFLLLKQTVTAGVVRYNFSMMNNSTAYNDVLVLDRGKVGIGTTNPSEKFTVAGTIMSTASSNPTLILQDSTHSNITIKGDSGIFSVTNQSVGQNITMLYNGNVGIGTTNPSHPLSVVSSYPQIKIQQTGQTPYFTFGSGSGFAVFDGVGTSNALLDIRDDGTSRIRIDTSGRVGIGTTSPSQKLEVSGKAKITTSLAVGSITPSATTGRIDAANDIVAFSTSDIRLKDNIKKIDKALDKVNSIQGIEFDWVEKEEVHGNSGHDIGVIAQEIEKVLPDVVTTRDNGYKAVKYEKIVPLLIEAIKDLSKQVDGLKRLI